jgi:hypothetical protein
VTVPMYDDMDWDPSQFCGETNQERNWVFGFGHDGVKQRVVGAPMVKGVIVDEGFPLWFASAKSVDVKISRIWLTAYSTSDVKVVLQKWCRDVIVECRPEPSVEFLQDMRDADLMLVGGPIPDILIQQGLWTSSISVVLATRGSRCKNPEPWLMRTMHVDHAMLGGVTNGQFSLWCYTQLLFQSKDYMVTTDGYLRADLRWVLKGGGEQGFPTVAPVDKESASAGKRIKFCGNNILSADSLWPVKHPDILVRTVYRHDKWVLRSLTTYERLLAFDVPEPLLKWLKEESSWKNLYDTLHLPGKVIQAAVEHVCLKVSKHMGNQILTTVVKKRKTLPVEERPAKVLKLKV